jgi:DUF1680 family protein
VRHDFDKCEATGRIANFAVAGGLAEGEFVGLFGFNDSDVHKVVEGAAYSLRLRPDPALERHLDEVVAKIAAWGVTVIAGRALGLHAAADGRSVTTREQDFLAVPYHVWAHRGDGEMAVWLPRRVRLDFAVP